MVEEKKPEEPVVIRYNPWGLDGCYTHIVSALIIGIYFLGVAGFIKYLIYQYFPGTPSTVRNLTISAVSLVISIASIFVLVLVYAILCGLYDGMRQFRYRRIANKIDNDTAYLTSTEQITHHQLYPKIISLGRDGLRYLLYDLRDGKSPEWRFVAIAEIASNIGKKPVVIPEEDQGHIDKMVSYHIEWARKNFGILFI